MLLELMVKNAPKMLNFSLFLSVIHRFRRPWCNETTSGDAVATLLTCYFRVSGGQLAAICPNKLSPIALGNTWHKGVLAAQKKATAAPWRSEERRVGKEGR